MEILLHQYFLFSQALLCCVGGAMLCDTGHLKSCEILVNGIFANLTVCSQDECD